MKESRTARACAIVTGLGWFLLYVGVLLAALNGVGTDARLYYRLQSRSGVVETAGIGTEELIRVDEALASYLAGDASALEATPFNEDEIAHMRDCFQLFTLLRQAMLLALGTGAALIALGTLALRYRGIMACAVAALCLVIPVACAAIWAAADFTGLFELFHRALFTNELWLMDPARDLMIRICPESMFETMAGITAGMACAFMILVILVHRIVIREERRRKYARLQ